MHEQIDYNVLAAQLRCPSGEGAIEIGEVMFESNKSMIYNTIDILNIQSSDSILEIGFGNGKHLHYLFKKAVRLKYNGVDISETMLFEAIKHNTRIEKEGIANFRLTTSSGELGFTNNNFDKCFTVNTICFWEDVQQQFKEINRVLKPYGRFSIAFIKKSFGEKLPFTKSEFTFYDEVIVESYLKNTGFNNIDIKCIVEHATSKDGQKVDRPIVIMSASKIN